jgi:hypothetical protein
MTLNRAGHGSSCLVAYRKNLGTLEAPGAAVRVGGLYRENLAASQRAGPYFLCAQSWLSSHQSRRINRPSVHVWDWL